MPDPHPGEIYICVDVETAGPIPPDYSLLSIGACTVFDPQSTFYAELQPLNDRLTAEASQVHKLSMERLAIEGITPADAMQHLGDWLAEQAPAPLQPVFVAFNAPFDWAFINYYFLHFRGSNPFGHAALDIKAYYMGQGSVAWSETSWRCISPNLADDISLTHHALQDALDQAALFKKLLAIPQNKNSIQGAHH